MVGLANVVDRKAGDKGEIQRRKAKDGEQLMESLFKTKTTKLDKI